MYLPIPVDFKDNFIQLLSSGATEKQALEKLQLSFSEYMRLLVEDPNFRNLVDEARKARAEVWVGQIIESLDEEPIDAHELAISKLRFDKLQFLAKADNPERYGSGNKKKDVNIELNITDYKNLSLDQANKLLKSDPFAVEAEFKEIKNEEYPL